MLAELSFILSGVDIQKKPNWSVVMFAIEWVAQVHTRQLKTIKHWNLLSLLKWWPPISKNILIAWFKKSIYKTALKKDIQRKSRKKGKT